MRKKKYIPHNPWERSANFLERTNMYHCILNLRQSNSKHVEWFNHYQKLENVMQTLQSIEDEILYQGTL